MTSEELHELQMKAILRNREMTLELARAMALPECMPELYIGPRPTLRREALNQFIEKYSQ